MEKKPASSERDLKRSLDELTKTIQRIPAEHDLFFHPGKHLFFVFLKGIVSGLGVLAAAAIAVPFILWMMKGVAWVPLIGDFVSDIATQVEDARSR